VVGDHLRFPTDHQQQALAEPEITEGTDAFSTLKDL
jgi:hypothetical protein